MREWARRLILSYLVVYNVPFPLGVLPVGIDFTPTFTGSSDTTEAYLKLIALLAIAAATATIWHAWKHGAPVSARTKDVVMVGVRYALGSALVSYGCDKLIPNQMPPPGPDRLLMPIGEASPMGLLWTFMGASPAYEMFSGFGEIVAGVLLFWRRTTLLGALVAAGVLTNVVALNFCYDVPVKLYSLQLLFTTLFVLAPHSSRLVDLFWRNRSAMPVDLRPFPLGPGWARWTALGVKTVLIARLIVGPLHESYQAATQYGVLAPVHALHGTYVVTSFNTTGTGGPAGDARWLRIGIDGRGRRATIQRATGRVSRLRCEVDERQGTLTLHDYSRASPAVLHYRVSEPGVVQVEGTYDRMPIVAVLRREPDGGTLTTRGFHWINELPYNR
jgi:uncharacterized membrane protein YphA (DoxX/SURF4 family)